ncbi:MAG: alpha/beta hydrolase, partial [Candidatus Hydrogenedentes bacterium]|nr:alpha/beta hydrolase [Candidatus Hydrogenedentota bacterium]
MLLTLIAASIFASAQDAGPGSTPETVIFIEDIAYGQESERQRLDILHPDDVRQPRPAIVHIHSGGWYTGGKGGEKTFAMLQAFADAGYVAVSIGYRLSGEAVFPAAVEDCKLAIRWLRANADAHGIDPERIGAIGASAGGHLAAMLA